MIPAALLGAALVAASPASATRAGDPEALALLSQARAWFTDLTSLQAQVVDEQETEEGKQRRTYRLYYERPDRIRIEYTAPMVHTLVSEGVHLWDYRPDRKEVRFASLSELTPAERIVVGMVAGFKIDLLAPLDTSRHDAFLKPGAPGTRVIQLLPAGGKPGVPPIELTVDLGKKVVRRMEVFTPDRDLAMSAEYGDFVRIPKEHWFGRTLRVETFLPHHTLEVRRMSEVVADAPLDPKLFAGAFPEGVEKHHWGEAP